MWPYPQKTTDLVISTEEILNGILHFLCSNSGFNCAFLTKLYFLIFQRKCDRISMKSRIHSCDTYSREAASDVTLHSRSLFMSFLLINFNQVCYSLIFLFQYSNFFSVFQYRSSQTEVFCKKSVLIKL